VTSGPRNCSVEAAGWSRSARSRPSWRAEATQSKARKREDEANQAEQEAAEPEAHGDAKAGKRAASRARGARKRADDAQVLAQRKAEASGFEAPTNSSPTDPLAMPLRQLPTDAAGLPKPQTQRNFTDPDSHILKGSDCWVKGYNAQAAVDGDHQVNMAIGVCNQASDAVNLLP